MQIALDNMGVGVFLLAIQRWGIWFNKNKHENEGYELGEISGVYSSAAYALIGACH